MDSLHHTLNWPTPSWDPFQIVASGQKAPYLRSLSSPDGLGDRLRFVAFAELQAAHAFQLAPQVFHHVPDGVKAIWSALAQEEFKHHKWIMERMEDLNVHPQERQVSTGLWASYANCTTAQQFADYMANAEDWGKQAGYKFAQTLESLDARSAKLFFQIAKEEDEHIRLAKYILEKSFKIEASDPNCQIRLSSAQY